MTKKTLKATAIALATVAAAGVLATLVVRDQISRHRRDLFSPYTLRRLAALGHMAGEEATVDHINLLNDYLAWEPRKLLRERARSILERMEEEARTPSVRAG